MSQYENSLFHVELQSTSISYIIKLLFSLITEKTLILLKNIRVQVSTWKNSNYHDIVKDSASHRETMPEN